VALKSPQGAPGGALKALKWVKSVYIVYEYKNLESLSLGMNNEM
jgi:hypothetical protein